MNRNRIIVSVVLMLSFVIAAIAQTTPSDVKDLVGVRASSGETQLEKRGYKFVKVTEGDDRKWSNWWNGSKSVCLTVVTMNGKYSAISSGPSADCDQGSSGAGGGTSAPSDVADLVGARGSTGETELERRGYKFVKVTEGDDRKWSNWWNGSKSACLTVVTMNGKYSAISSGPSADCDQGSSGAGGGTSAPSDVADLVGARASSGESALKSRGYTFVKTEKGDDRTWTNWWNRSKGACLTVVTMDGKYSAISSGPSADCNQSGNIGGNAGTRPPKVNLRDLIGVRASSGEVELQKRGFVNVGAGKITASYTVWQNRETAQCVMVTTKDGKYSRIDDSYACPK